MDWSARRSRKRKRRNQISEKMFKGKKEVEDKEGAGEKEEQ